MSISQNLVVFCLQCWYPSGCSSQSTGTAELVYHSVNESLPTLLVRYNPCFLQDCLVGFFDILFIQNLLRGNSVSDTCFVFSTPYGFLQNLRKDPFKARRNISLEGGPLPKPKIMLEEGLNLYELNIIFWISTKIAEVKSP